MADGESTFNPKNPNNFNVEAQFLLIPGFLILAIVDSLSASPAASNTVKSKRFPHTVSWLHDSPSMPENFKVKRKYYRKLKLVQVYLIYRLLNSYKQKELERLEKKRKREERKKK